MTGLAKKLQSPPYILKGGSLGSIKKSKVAKNENKN